MKEACETADGVEGQSFYAGPGHVLLARSDYKFPKKAIFRPV
jgi:hypothetical protein